jgi:hypothetical protein
MPVSEPEIRWKAECLPGGWSWIARSMPGFTCSCGTVTHYGWRDPEGKRLCEPCGSQVILEVESAKAKPKKSEEAPKPKRARRKLA